jgi:hypothetical protein
MCTVQAQLGTSTAGWGNDCTGAVCGLPRLPEFKRTDYALRTQASGMAASGQWCIYEGETARNIERTDGARAPTVRPIKAQKKGGGPHATCLPENAAPLHSRSSPPLSLPSGGPSPRASLVRCG